ncbi:sensor histidine kinase [Nocardia africana]|uniref:histidine kinase n=1 Tax=Nocardia africana TaxID=134964 RepID=A0A378X4D3_9NOCA|nr:HAMP domain-containing sensor histidine kinase [Nocardia africana]MCC3316958.1 HAMP domain-containing histidine kinase [Nocardia africana]SUA47685.1 Probable sensor histidine kinase TcrY [Nocardia africana]
MSDDPAHPAPTRPGTPDPAGESSSLEPAPGPDHFSAPAAAEPGPRALPTISLRRRVTLTAAVISGLALIVVALAVHSLFGIVVARSANTVLTDRVQLARQLAQQNTAPAELIARVDNRSVRARLVLADGTVYGSLSPRHAGDGGPRTRTVTLGGGGTVDRARLTLQVDTPLLTAVRSRLGLVLIGVTATAIVAITAALWVGLRHALAPLDSMTRLAREIARGGRGRRLSPARTDTELGRTAAAFDEMLDALEGAEARARASEQQMRAFVGDAAHELRTPIAGIKAMAEAVLHQPADTGSEDRERMYLLLVREAQRAGRLVEDLLDMARIDAGLALYRQSVDLYDLAHAQVDRMRILHPDIDFRLTGHSVLAVADPERVGQILVNLLANACQATPPGGAVSIAVGTVTETAGSTPAGPMPIPVRPADRAGPARAPDTTPSVPAIPTLPGTGTGGVRAEIRVADTGPGVPPAQREHIFGRLVRLDASRDHRRDGAGMGLAIARGLARAHGGDLRCVEPPPGTSGAVFVLTLPTRDPGPGSPDGPSAA